MAKHLYNMLRGCCLVQSDSHGIRVEPLRFISPRLTLDENYDMLVHFRTGEGGRSHHGKAA
ncbi:hypothetical protein HY78_08535 [Rhizorhabdus wittichii DC-6]|nr:hypothetical protein HY78_08535 [Rhizorhabdus wittichii DC-6]